MGPGGCVQVQSGAHKELYGKVFQYFCLDNCEQNAPKIIIFFLCFIKQIEGVDADNARVMVKLAIGSKTVTISQYAVRLVGRKEYEKYGKDLSK